MLLSDMNRDVESSREFPPAVILGKFFVWIREARQSRELHPPHCKNAQCSVRAGVGVLSLYRVTSCDKSMTYTSLVGA